MALPKFILLKSITTNKYLRYRKEDDSKHALLEFSQDAKEENAEIQYVKFEVQKSETMEGFVHIRNCYNNKFWVRKSGDEGSEWIAAEANEAEEDPSKGSSTLFKAVLVDGDVDGGDVEEHKDHTTMEPQKIRLVHVDQLGQQGCVALAGSELLVLGDVDSRADDGVFVAYDATSVIRLPDHVAFMGHNNEYATLTTLSGVTYMEFRTRDIANAGVAHELSQWLLDNPPFVTVQNSSTSMRWSPSGNFLVLIGQVGIWAHLTPITLGGNNIALRDGDIFSGSGGFANSFAGNGMEHVLGRSATSISENAVFRLEEPVLQRSISNVVFNLVDARVHSIGSMEMFRDERRNNTSTEQAGTFGVEYTVTESRTWSDSISVTTGISASMSASIPFVGVSFGVELSTERNQNVTFGNEVSESRTVSYEQGIIIPPGKKVTMLVLATRAQCDVPFRSTVVDIMTDGTRREYTRTDGLFKGANEFSFRTEMLEEDL